MDDQTNQVEAQPSEAGVAALGRGGRISRQRKSAAVLRLLRGEDLETVSRLLGVTAATLSGWREAFLSAGEASLSDRPADGGPGGGGGGGGGRRRAGRGEMLLERELLEARIALLEARPGPLARRCASDEP